MTDTEKKIAELGRMIDNRTLELMKEYREHVWDAGKQGVTDEYKLFQTWVCAKIAGLQILIQEGV